MQGAPLARVWRFSLAIVPMLMLFGNGCEQRETTPASAEVRTVRPDEFQLPRPITPLMPPVVDEPEKVQLGKSLFNDRRLSGNESIACASCHDISAGGDDGWAVSIGINGRRTSVNAPTVLNSALNFTQFWDGRARTLKDQIEATVESPIEMGGDWRVIERKLADDRIMAKRFARLYDDGVTKENIAGALQDYLRALITWDTPFDRYLAGDSDAVGEDVKSGYALFKQLGCISCHQGRNIGGNLFQRFGIVGDYFSARGDVTPADYGRYNVTGREADRYKFKVPSLRNVADTAPYFHDGSAETLEDAIRAMLEYQLGRPADEDEIVLLVAFLTSLSGPVDQSLR